VGTSVLGLVFCFASDRDQRETQRERERDTHTHTHTESHTYRVGGLCVCFFVGVGFLKLWWFFGFESLVEVFFSCVCCCGCGGLWFLELGI